MTAVGFPDLIVHSPGGTYRAEARSPDNGTINQRDGSPPDTSSFGYQYQQEQRSFRFQLRDQRTENVDWERWQPEDEKSPRRLMVSDDGWVVIQTHGYSYATLIGIDPSGNERVRVEVGVPRRNGDHPCNAPRWANVVEDSHISMSTAGISWTIGGFHYFLQHDQRTHFVFMLGWGRRIVIDLDGGRLRKEEEHDARLIAACELAEREKAMAYLTDAAGKLEDHDANDLFGGTKVDFDYLLRWYDLETYLGVIVRQRVAEAIPLISAMEPVAMQRGSHHCSTLPGDRYRSAQQFCYRLRPMISLGLRYLEQRPRGFPCYGFFHRQFQGREDRVGVAKVLPVPECVLDRDRLTASIDDKMTSGDVLSLLGAPDHIRRVTPPSDGSNGSGEQWDYYVGLGNHLSARRIVWKPGSNGSTMESLETVSLTTEMISERIYRIRLGR